MSYAPRQRRSWLVRLVPLFFGLIFIAFYAARGCQEGPFGRTQIVGLDSNQEVALGAQAFAQVLQQSDVLESGPAVEVVRRLASQLTAASEKPEVLEYLKIKKRDFPWDARVVRSKDANAFCLPGGKIVVFTGIFPVAETEGGLAAVMGHEIGHALASHGAERMAQQQMIQIGQQAVAGALGDMDVQQQRMILGILGAGAKFGVVLPFSRSHESEADRIGLVLMAAAGYDPKLAIKLWQNMARNSQGQPSEFASTHPSHETRIRDIEGWLEEANVFYREASPKHPDSPLPITGAERAAGQPGPERGIPAKALQLLRFVDEYDEAPAGHVGGRAFGNVEGHLPSRDKSGQAIRYREWDVNPTRQSGGRDAERLVTGSDGSAYYTADHYRSFRRIR